MKFSILAVCLAFLNICAFGQKIEKVFGEISMEEMTMKNYPPDTSAAAVVLYQKGDRFASDERSMYNIHERLKIFKSSALEAGKWGDHKFYEWHDVARTFKIEAAVYNLENGVIVKTEMGDEGVHVIRFNRYTDEISFRFPNAKAGSVIEFKYRTVTSQFSWPIWHFQREIPVLYSDYTIGSEASFNYYLSGSIKPVFHEERKSGKSHHWILTDIPAFKEEPFMPYSRPYMSSVQTFSSLAAWRYFNEIVYSDYTQANYLVLNREFKRKAQELAAISTDTLAKIKAISDYVKQTIIFDGNVSQDNYTIAKLSKDRQGGSGDVNLFLIAMLTEANIKANLVFLSTRDHGRVNQGLVNSRQFNNLICLVFVKNKPLFLDATDKFVPYDLLPAYCYNGPALVIGKPFARWIAPETEERDKILVSAELTLHEGTDLKGTVNLTRSSFNAYAARSDYERDPSEYHKQFESDKHWSVINHKTENPTEIETPFKEGYDLHIFNHVNSAGDKMLVDPFVALWETRNPFSSDERLYPIDFGLPFEKLLFCNISIPEGYEVETLPENKAYAIPNNAARCSFSFSQSGNKIVVVSKFVMNKTYYEPDEYHALREFYTRIIAKRSEPVVLRKKK